MVVTQELTGPAAADPATAARIAWMTTSLGVGALIGVLLTLLEQNARWRPYVPSPTGMGIAMLIPVNAVTMIFLGAAADSIWAKTSPESHERYSIPIASGLIAGEALVAVIIPLLATVGFMSLP